MYRNAKKIAYDFIKRIVYPPELFLPYVSVHFSPPWARFSSRFFELDRHTISFSQRDVLVVFTSRREAKRDIILHTCPKRKQGSVNRYTLYSFCQRITLHSLVHNAENMDELVMNNYTREDRRSCISGSHFYVFD